MAVPTITTGATTESSSTSFSANLPTHLTNDVLFLTCGNSLASTISASNGFSSVGALLTPGTGSYQMFYKRATSASESTTITVTSGTTNITAFGVRGCITTGTPFEDMTRGSNASDATVDSSEVTSTAADRLAICSAAIIGFASYSSGLPPSGWTDAFGYESGAGVDRATIYKSVPTATTVTSVVVATLTFASASGTFTFLCIAPTNVDAPVADATADSPNSVPSITLAPSAATGLGDSAPPIPEFSVTGQAIARKGTAIAVPTLSITPSAALALGDVPQVELPDIQARPYANISLGVS